MLWSGACRWEKYILMAAGECFTSKAMRDQWKTDQSNTTAPFPPGAPTLLSWTFVPLALLRARPIHWLIVVLVLLLHSSPFRPPLPCTTTTVAVRSRHFVLPSRAVFSPSCPCCRPFALDTFVSSPLPRVLLGSPAHQDARRRERVLPPAHPPELPDQGGGARGGLREGVRHRHPPPPLQGTRRNSHSGSRGMLNFYSRHVQR